jgi:hypothetical protein
MRMWTRRSEPVREFQLVNIRSVIEACDKRLPEIFQYLYELCIDQGRHPNQRAIMGSVKMEELADRKLFQQVYLHGDGVVLDATLKNVVEAGLCTLFLTQHNPTFTARFEILGVKARLTNLRRDVSKLVKK